VYRRHMETVHGEEVPAPPRGRRPLLNEELRRSAARRRDERRRPVQLPVASACWPLLVGLYLLVSACSSLLVGLIVGHTC